MTRPEASSIEPFAAEQAPPSARFFWQNISPVEALHWLRLLWPTILVVFSSFIFFRHAVIATLIATPHPALVLGIWLVCFMAIGVTVNVVKQYLQELQYAKKWLQMSSIQRAVEVERPRQFSVFMPVYDLLSGQQALSPESRQAAVTAELEAAEIALEQKLELPNFLAGALVGLGLVGTFVGLLGTLEDLSKVFTALVNTGTSTMSPTQMFSDMVTKLQAPMQGMGTAFVASLYGLLGSLIVTLMLVSARKTAASTFHQIQAAVRQVGYGAISQGRHNRRAGQAVLSGMTANSVGPSGGDAIEVTTRESFMMQSEPDSLDTLRWLKTMQTTVEELTKNVTAHQMQQDLIARQTSHLVQELLIASQTTAASQQRSEKNLQQFIKQSDHSRQGEAPQTPPASSLQS